MRHSLLALAIAVACACTPESRTTPPAASTSPAATAAPSPVAPNAPPAPSPAASGDQRCAQIRKRFNDELAKRTDACSTDADCACHGAEGGGCGGITDKATAARLAPISAEFHREKCRYEVQCAAWACEPKCVSGRCG